MNKLKKIVIGTAIAGSVAGGGIATDQIVLGIPGHIVMTQGQYKELKNDVADKASRNVFNERKEIKLFAALLNREQKKCGGHLYPITCKQDIRDMLKKFNKGCPEIIKVIK